MRLCTDYEGRRDQQHCLFGKNDRILPGKQPHLWLGPANNLPRQIPAIRRIPVSFGALLRNNGCRRQSLLSIRPGNRSREGGTIALDVGELATMGLAGADIQVVPPGLLRCRLDAVADCDHGRAAR